MNRGEEPMKNIENTKVDKKSKSARKYFNFVLLMVAIVLVALIVSNLYKNHQNNKLGTSVFSSSGLSIQYDDIDNTLSEMPSDSFILISFVKNENVKKMESELKKAVVNNGLESNLYYLDATDLMYEENYIQKLNEKFSLNDANKIDVLPALLYFQDGTFKRTVTSTESRMIEADDFNKLLDNYEIIEQKLKK